MSEPMPAMLRGLIDDAAVFPPGNAALEDAVPAHRGHRDSWYSDMVGPLLVPVSRLADLEPGGSGLRIGVIVDCEPEYVREALGDLDPRVEVVQYESRAALHHLAKAAEDWEAPVFAELPFGEEPLEAVVGTGFTPKFRTGGPSEEFFPPPGVLAGSIVGCARRSLPFKLTAGLHRAVRHRDSETGFVHHGFLNVLVASAEAAAGADTDRVAELLDSTDAADLAARSRAMIDRPRPLWAGFGSCSVDEPLEDLLSFSLLTEGGDR
ncbi:hypothetical protein [Glycomyces xiaoerkulensis]|uniref:hypothetical protein n=1 Tax=Glycomyces xiaoerkulensis TaxID=2038139 RepID=UPI000C2606B3|nr:hypothetical protein [Glycomyces xiaoerkulensis]